MSNTTSTSLLKGRWTIWIISLALSLAAGFGVLTIVGSAAEQATYYAVSTDLPARTLITEDNVKTVTASADGIPPTALTLSQLQAQPLYTRIALNAGEPLTSSNTGPISPINSNLPEGYVVASLAVAPENAAGGRITRGDYIDIAAIDGQTGSAKTVLSNVLVLDVTVSPSDIAEAATSRNGTEDTGPDSQASRRGIPQLYVLAVSPTDFNILALIRDNDAYLALSQGVSLDPSAGLPVNESSLFAPGVPSDSGLGTEDTVLNQDSGLNVSPSPSPSVSGVPSPTTSPTSPVSPSPSSISPRPSVTPSITPSITPNSTTTP